MIGDVTFYPNYIWASGFAAASEPEVTTVSYTSSGGETSGGVYDVLDAKRTTLLTTTTDGLSDTFGIDLDLNASILNANFMIVDNHNLYDAEAEITFHYGVGNTSITTTSYSGALGSAMTAFSGNQPNDDGVILSTFSALSSANWELQIDPISNYAADITFGEWFVGKYFSPSTAPEVYDVVRNYHGVNVSRSLGGQNSSKKYYGERKAWTLKWSYVDESDKDSFLTVFGKTEGPRYPFYIDLGEESTPKLYFVRLTENTLKIRKLTASAYEVSFTIESEV